MLQLDTEVIILQLNSLQCGAPKIAKLVYNSNVTMIYGTYNYSIHGVYKSIYDVWGPHIVGCFFNFSRFDLRPVVIPLLVDFNGAPETKTRRFTDSENLI